MKKCFQANVDITTFPAPRDELLDAGVDNTIKIFRTAGIP
jgi:hypothetical protein